MTAQVLERLRCPVCHASVYADGDGKICACKGARRHTFDFSKSGYLNLSRAAQSGGGDSKEAVRSRSAFLEAGYYRPLSDAVNRLLDRVGAESVLDAGCGEGYYTNRMAERRVTFVADLSVHGIDYAAKQSKRLGSGAGFAVASLFELPVADESFSAVTNLFAPCAETEFSRVLETGGLLIVVGAGERHLMGLKEAIYESPYLNRERRDLPTEMRLAERLRVTDTVTVEGREAIAALFSMTPYYWRTGEADREKLSLLDRLTTEIDFDIFLYRKEA